MGEILKAPRGTNDILPPETLKWSYVEEVMRRLADRYGYEEVRTPIFELTQLFQRGVGEGSDIVSKEMYTFTDKGGRSLTLRPEMTAPAVRAYLEAQLTQISLVKWYYIGPGFRYERPQSGRFRQFHQFGVEAIGSMNPALDAEAITLALDIFNELELKNLEVRLNSIGCKVCRPAYREKLRNYFAPLLEDLCQDCKTHRYEKNPLRILDCKVERCRPTIEKAPVPSDALCEECLVHFKKVMATLEGVSVPVAVDPHLVRGLEYYTKTVFEVVSSSLGAQNSLCGGGRYDDLAEILGGPSKPAVGFALGIERLVQVMESSGSSFPGRGVDLFVISLGEKAEDLLFSVMRRLRQQGLRVRGDYHGRSLGTQLKEADRLGARWALILGENELAREEAILRNLQSRTQEAVPLGDLGRQLTQKIVTANAPVSEYSRPRP